MADLHTRSGHAVPLARLLATEIAVGTAINIAFNLFFAWAVFYGRTPIGRDGVLLDTIPAAFLPAFLMTFPVTGVMRRRIRNGLTISTTARLPMPLPKKLPLRAGAIAVLALALVSAPATSLLWLCWGADWDWTTMVVFKVGFSAFHAVLITPIVVMGSLGLDRPD